MPTSPAGEAATRPGIFVPPFERGQIGPDLFTAACRMQLECVVSNISSGDTGPGPAIG